MTKADLLAELVRLRRLLDSKSKDESGRLQAERDTYAAELEFQNRELREAQQLLEESRDRYADLYDFAPTAYANLSESGVILDINLTGARLLGRERSRLVGFPLILFTDKSGIATILGHVNQCLRDDEQWQRSEVTLLAHDGTAVPVELLSRVALDGGKKVLRTAILDLTERRRADSERERRKHEEAQRAQAEQANAIKDTFLATLSHELRTPLNAMTSWLHVLRLKPDDVELRKRGFQVIENNVHQQTQLVNDLLDVARIGRSDFRIERKRVHLVALAEAVAANLRPMAHEKGVDLTTRWDAARAEVDGDEARLQQVVSNLLTNAVRFTPAGGTVELRVTLGESDATGVPLWVVITVRDTGIGIAPEFLPHVFDRFRQADSSTRRRHSGLGLGLSIARELVTAHGGRIRAESDGEGRGALFTVELPLAKPAALLPDDGQQPLATLAPDALAGVEVLQVDDDATAREVVAMYLQRGGAIVTSVAGVAEARSAVEAHCPAVVVSDIAMPDADGYDLIHWLRARAPEVGGRIPAIALSAFTAPADRQRALAAGYDVHLAKPCRPAELMAEILQLSGRAKLAQSRSATAGDQPASA